MVRIRNPWLACVSIVITVGMLMKLVEPSSDGYQKCLEVTINQLYWAFFPKTEQNNFDDCLSTARGRACGKCKRESDRNCKASTEKPYVEPWTDGYERCLGKCE
ncbi:hypothetical protein CRM22_011153, partial [Opisthorchis felineus]